MPEVHRVSVEIGGTEISFETGWMAKQASGAVVVRAGDTVVLNTATAGNLRDVDFLPLTVDVEERMYAAGKIPGSFFKREGRAGEKATLIARMIDRPLRPLFPKGWRRETQLVGMPLSVDQVAAYDVLAMNGASAALADLRHPVPDAGRRGADRQDRGQLRHQPDRGAAARVRPRPRRVGHRGGHPDGRGRAPTRSPRPRSSTRSTSRTARSASSSPRSASWPRRPASRSSRSRCRRSTRTSRARSPSRTAPRSTQATQVEDKLERQAATKAVEEEVLEQYSGDPAAETYAEFRQNARSSRSTRSRRSSSASASRSRRSARTAASRTRSARSTSRSSRCRARTARRCSPAARRRPCPWSPSAPRARRCGWTTSGWRRPSATSTTTTSRRSRWARPASCAAPSAVTSATARSPSARWSR